MIGLEIRFLAGRFHANPWNHAHNEGVPEWPPSPWRVLRSLVSAAYAEDLGAGDMEPLLQKLSVLPSYGLPLAVDAHTRHYMPDTDDPSHKRSKVFDAFVAVEGGAQDPLPVTLAWRTELAPEERSLLERLCRRISYVGRAESWADVRVVDVQEGRWQCLPSEDGMGAAATTLLSLSSPEAFAAWAAGQPPVKKGQDLPRSFWDVLSFDSDRFRDEGWSSVPGTRLARYVFVDGPPFRRAVVPAAGRRATIRPTIARFAIRSAVLPRLEEALAVAERLRVSAMSRARESGDERGIFSGHGTDARDHRHAMYLASGDALENAKRGQIDHLVVAARAGFDEDDVRALQGLRRLWGKGGHDLELVLVGLGQPTDFGGLTAPHSRLLARSRVWQSVTPFVPTRHPKKVRGVEVDSIEDQLRRGCEQLIGVRPVEVSPFGDRAFWARFRRRRKPGGGGSRGPDWAIGARLVFDEPVLGPLALGYGAHVGLGVFGAAEDTRT